MKTPIQLKVLSIACKALVAILILFVAVLPVHAQKNILVQSTTSTANSGLYDHLLPKFNATHDINVKIIAVGTGQAIRNAKNCDADVLLVHAKNAEEMFVSDGYGVERFDLMYNDFIIVGPDNDPANIADAKNISTALTQIATKGSLFASRGDDSGTHKKEISLWQAAEITPDNKWYRSTGSGMGATLNTGVGLGAYVMTDRATWITYGNKSNYRILYEGDKSLFNQYGVIRVNENQCPNVDVTAAQTFIEWMLSEEGQRSIGGYAIDGQQLFFPNANI